MTFNWADFGIVGGFRDRAIPNPVHHLINCGKSSLFLIAYSGDVAQGYSVANGARSWRHGIEEPPVVHGFERAEASGYPRL